MVHSVVGHLVKVSAGFALISSIFTGSALADAVPADRSRLDPYVHDYFMTDPGVIREALQKSKTEKMLLHAKALLRNYKDQLYKSGAPELGNPDAKVTIVAFLDYNCPYCRSAYTTLKTFLKKNPDTKLVIRDTASFGKDSESVGRIALAARNQGKFEAMHDALISAKGKLGEQHALAIAAELGLDIPRLKKDALSPDVEATLAASENLAKQLKVTAVPLIIVGYRGIQGAPDDLMTQITSYVEEIRTSGCEVC